MRRASLFLLLLLTLALAGCSYSTSFVVVNESKQPVEISYKYKSHSAGGPFELHELPARVAADLLESKGGNEWQELGPSDYVLDRENRVVRVRIMPGEALRIYRFINYRGHEDTRNYPFEEISIRGENGEVKYTGEKARSSFSEVSMSLYTLTY